MRCRSVLLSVLTLALFGMPAGAAPLPGTKELELEGDLAARMVAGIGRYLDRELAGAAKGCRERWKVDLSSREGYLKSVEPHRDRLKQILGVVDERVPCRELAYVSSTAQGVVVGQTDDYRVYAVRWPVLPGVEGEGLLLEPKEEVSAFVIALPEADWTPEMLVGMEKGVADSAQFARRLAENGCRVVVPTLINRQDTFSGNERLKRMTNQPHREFVYRMAFEMGRHVLGYEIQKVLALVDFASGAKERLPIGVMGYGEGGLLALYCAAVDSRIGAAVVSGYFGPRADTWKEPIYRNVWGLLRDFSPETLMLLTLPRLVIFECCHGPVVDGPPEVRPGRGGAAPGRLVAVDGERMQAEIHDTLMGSFDTYRKIENLFNIPKQGILANDDGKLPGNDTTLRDLLAYLLKRDDYKLAPSAAPPAELRKDFDPAERQRRQLEQLVGYTQHLMRQSEYRRQEWFWSRLDRSSMDAYRQSCERPRKELWEQLIGRLPAASVPPNPRTRQILDEEKWVGYEVVLDVHPDVIAYGILLIPKGLKLGERRPVVVCQHGLEGRPIDVVNPRMKTRAYNSYGAELADMGYVVYAPQNPYIGRDDFRVLQRKANLLGLSLFSFIIEQHSRTLDWLEALPFVDKGRIAFYGLSYGGKTAMRVPAVLERYCLSICSGDFNEWVWKNVSVDFRGSYMFTGEYEMYEFNLGHTFSYAEMAALIAPRPFMVERGHRDGVGIDEWVAYEYAKVRRHYSDLGVADRTEIEFFSGGHEIHGQGTYRFLKKHLNWPR